MRFLDDSPRRQLESLVVIRRSLNDDEQGGLLPGHRSPVDSSRRRLTSQPQFFDDPPLSQLESLVVIRISLDNDERARGFAAQMALSQRFLLATANVATAIP